MQKLCLVKKLFKTIQMRKLADDCQFNSLLIFIVIQVPDLSLHERRELFDTKAGIPDSVERA